MRKFSGDDHLVVKVWVNEVNEYAEVMQWSPRDKLCAAKRALIGTAASVADLAIHRTWESLRDSLLTEFAQTRNTQEVYELLGATQINADEGLLAYTVRMQKLAMLGEVDVRSLIQFIIDGIDDRPQNKQLLYDATTMREFKEKLNVYRCNWQELPHRQAHTHRERHRQHRKGEQRRKCSVKHQHRRRRVQTRCRCTEDDRRIQTERGGDY